MKTKQCPYCGEKINIEAIKCRFCGEFLGPKKPPDQSNIILPAEADKITISVPNKSKRIHPAVIVTAMIIIFLGVLVVVNELKQQENARQYNNQKSFITTEYNNCISEVEAQYTVNWANQCKSYAKTVEDGYNTCLGPYMSANDCRGIWGTPDPGANCSLPHNRAQSVEDGRTQGKSDCLLSFPINQYP